MTKEESFLRLYIDSADPREWEKHLATGLFYGVTTNPKLIAKAGLSFNIDDHAQLANTALSLGAQEIHLQIWGSGPEEMLEIGRKLAAIDARVMVKIPITFPGILLANRLIREGTQVTLTALHSAQQVLIAIASGAKYAAPYLGRMTDGGVNGLEEVIQMGQIIQKTKSDLNLVVASIRQSNDLVSLGSNGISSFTLLPQIIQELFDNKLTDKAVESFDGIVQKTLSRSQQ